MQPAIISERGGETWQHAQKAEKPKTCCCFQAERHNQQILLSLWSSLNVQLWKTQHNKDRICFYDVQQQNIKIYNFIKRAVNKAVWCGHNKYHIFFPDTSLLIQQQYVGVTFGVFTSNNTKTSWINKVMDVIINIHQLLSLLSSGNHFTVMQHLKPETDNVISYPITRTSRI